MIHVEAIREIEYVTECVLVFYQETKLITHKSYSMVKENENYLKDIEDILKNDKRYLMLDHVPDERRDLVMEYLDDLEKRGPPPPPTASEPSRRIVK